MPNGRPGDHPLTDIVVHGQTAFGERIDALIRDLDAIGLWASPIATEWLYERFWDYREAQQRGGQGEVDRVLAHLESQLVDERRRLRSEHG